MRREKKAQAWGIDLMIAMVIFTAGITVFYFYILNQPNYEESVENLIYDGKIMTNTLLSEGYPEDWNSMNIVKIGIFSNNKINETKLERFYNLVQTDYEKTKNLFNTKYNYYFFLDEDMTISGGDIEGIGKPGVTKDNINALNLIKITRFIVYKDKPITAYLYIWE